MSNKSSKTFFYIFIILFIVLNMMNTFFVTSSLFNKGMNLYKSSFGTFMSSFIGDLGFLIVILALVFIFSKKRKTIVILLTVFTAALSTIIFLLKIYSFYYGTAFSFFTLRTFSNEAPILGKQLTAFLWSNLFKMGQYFAITPAIIMIVLTIILFTKKHHKSFIDGNKEHSWNSFFKLFIIGLSLYSVTLVNYTYNVNASSDKFTEEPLEAVQQMGVYNFYSHNLFSYLTTPKNTIPVLGDDLIEKENLYLNNIKETNPLNFFDEETTNSLPIFKDKNLIVIQMESFNNFLINLKITDPDTGVEYEVTPFINSLVNNDNNLYYNSFYSNIGVGKTGDAEFAFFTGINPDGKIVSYYDYVNQDYETLPKLFNKKDYQVYSVNGSTKNFYMREVIYPLLGVKFENFFPRESLEAEGYYNPADETHTINGWVDDNVVFEKVLDILRKDEKQFVFALSTVLHSPYAKHSYITDVNDWSSIINGQMGRYLDYAKYFDDAFKLFYTTALQENLFDNTIIMLYGDHKSDLSMNEHLKLFPEAADHLYNQKLANNIPLIVITDGTDLSNYKDSTSLVRGQTDLKRTIANLFDLDAVYKFGVDIFSTDKTVTYVPLTLDVFTDDFQLNFRGKTTDNPNITEEEINQFVEQFIVFKKENDLLFQHPFFGELDDGT